MNVITAERAAKLRELLLQGESTRYAAETIGVAKNTSMMFKRRLVAECGTIFCKCGKVAGHKAWCGFRIARSPAMTAYRATCWKDVGQLNIFIPSRPRYERPDIPNERETEIPLLVNRRNSIALDAPLIVGQGTQHERITGITLNPLEMLILKEENETLETAQRRRDIKQWESFMTRKNSAFNNPSTGITFYF